MSLSLAFIRDAAGLEALRPEWDQLFAEATNVNAYLSYGWSRVQWDRWALRHPRALYICTLRDGERLVLIAPFVRVSRALRPTRIEGLTTVLPQTEDMLIRDGTDATVATEFLLKGIARANPLALLRLKRLAGSSPIHAAMTRRHVSMQSVGTVGADVKDGFDAYFATVSGAIRSKHRRMLKRLEGLGRVSFTLDDPARRYTDIQWMLRLKREQWWAEGTRPRRWLISPSAQSDFLQLTHTKIAPAGAVLGTLRVGDTTIAAMLAFTGGTNASIYVATYDPAYADYSPGRTAILLMIEKLATLGITRVDFMAGSSELKLRLGDPGPPIYSLQLPLYRLL
ncbi:MAG: GNAT family N-acetyltransferase [Devosia sp.]